MEDKREHYVYVIPDEYGEPCYIGSGKERRIKKHMQRALKGVIDPNKAKSQYLIDCVSRGIIIKPYKVAENLTKEEGLAYERTLIAWYGRRDLGLGCLFNGSDGGLGVTNLAPASRDRINYILRENPTPAVLEARRQHSLFMAGRKKGPMSSETKLKLSLAKRGWVPSLEARKNMSAAQKGKTMSLEARQNMSEAAKKRTPEDRAKTAEIRRKKRLAKLELARLEKEEK